MSETLESQDIAEMGKDGFGKLTVALENRDRERYNSVGWGGTTADLKELVGSNSLCPASAFAVVVEGLVKYKRQESELRENTDSLRELAGALSSGSGIFKNAYEIGGPTLLGQIRNYVESHGGVFNESINWQDLLNERSQILIRKADAFDAINA